jgi:hypothetical protein
MNDVSFVSSLASLAHEEPGPASLGLDFDQDEEMPAAGSKRRPPAEDLSVVWQVFRVGRKKVQQIVCSGCKYELQRAKVPNIEGHILGGWTRVTAEQCSSALSWPRR